MKNDRQIGSQLSTNHPFWWSSVCCFISFEMSRAKPANAVHNTAETQTVPGSAVKSSVRNSENKVCSVSKTKVTTAAPSSATKCYVDTGVCTVSVGTDTHPAKCQGSVKTGSAAKCTPATVQRKKVPVALAIGAESQCFAVPARSDWIWNLW
jgi:hypothetical protein